MTLRPFRFGVMSTGDPAGAKWLDLARRTEDLGFDVLHVPQHFSMRSVPPLPALAFAAAATTTLRVGTLVLDNEAAHPAVVARDAAWLAGATGGRFELGIGAGWLAEDHTVLGGSWRSAGERVSRLEEALVLIRACWAGEPVTFAGEHYTVDGLANGASTADPPRILVGGGGPRLLGVAARYADVVGIAPDMRSGRIGKASAQTTTVDLVTDKADRVRALAAERGAEVELQIAITAVIDRADTERLARTASAFGVDPAEVDTVPSVLVGTSPEITDRLGELRAATGISYVSVHESMIDRIAPVVAELAGR